MALWDYDRLVWLARSWIAAVYNYATVVGKQHVSFKAMTWASDLVCRCLAALPIHPRPFIGGTTDDISENSKDIDGREAMRGYKGCKLREERKIQKLEEICMSLHRLQFTPLYSHNMCQRCVCAGHNRWNKFIISIWKYTSLALFLANTNTREDYVWRGSTARHSHEISRC